MNKRPAPQVIRSWLGMVLTVALPLTVLLCWLSWLFWSAALPLLLFGWGSFLLLLCGVYLPLRWRSMCFSLDEKEMIVTGGVVFTTTRRMRVDAVRQVTLLQGPLERRYGIAFLLVSGTGGYLLVEGLARDRAEAWCRQLTAQ